jgi:hypothetical protein
MAEVVWPPGEGRGLLGRSERQLAGFDPGAPVAHRTGERPLASSQEGE